MAINKPLGRVIIKYCEPISLKQFVQSKGVNAEQIQDEKVQQGLISDLGKEISLAQTDNLIVMSTPLVASVLLLHRRGIS